MAAVRQSYKAVSLSNEEEEAIIFRRELPYSKAKQTKTCRILSHILCNLVQKTRGLSTMILQILFWMTEGTMEKEIKSQYMSRFCSKHFDIMEIVNVIILLVFSF